MTFLIKYEYNLRGWFTNIADRDVNHSETVCMSENINSYLLSAEKASI